MEPVRPLEEEMAPLERKGVEWYFIAGNHDADSQELARRVWSRRTEPHNIHARVVTLPCGLRLAGLAGVFRPEVWYPQVGDKNGGRTTHYSRSDLARVTPQQRRFNPYGDEEPELEHVHWASIFEEEYDTLAEMHADILVTHEAPSYHSDFSLKGSGFQAIDELAQFLGARYVVHGHQHDDLDSSAYWVRQGFETHGIGLRGVSALWPDGRWEVVVPGEIDEMRRQQRQRLDFEGGR
jgi:hypothetical protein